MKVSSDGIPYPNPLACAHIMTNSKWKSDASNAASMCNTASKCRAHNLWVHSFQSRVHPCTKPESDKILTTNAIIVFLCITHHDSYNMQSCNAPNPNQYGMRHRGKHVSSLLRRCFVASKRKPCALQTHNVALRKKHNALLKKTIRFARNPMQATYENIAIC